MNQPHWILAGLWIAFYTCHSVLASTSAKDLLKRKLGRFARFYRLGYSLLAFLMLGAVLLYQYSFYSPVLMDSLPLKYLSVFLLVIPGLVIMAVSIWKYFMLLSGIRSLYTPVETPELKVNGIHRYVRHPLYSGTMLCVTGLFFIFPSLSNLVATALLIIYTFIGIIFEEKKLKREFGSAYENYMAKVPKLVPRLGNRSGIFRKTNHTIFDK